MKHLFSFKVFTGNDVPATQVVSSLPAFEWRDVLMKKLCWIVIISYMFMLCKPVVPIVKDAIAHTFWEQQHLLIVHEENGKFHVHQETVKAGGLSDKERPARSTKATIEDNYCVASNIGDDVPVCIFAQEISHTSYVSSKESADKHVLYIPPKI